MAASASGALANARQQDLRQVASNGTATSCKTTAPDKPAHRPGSILALAALAQTFAIGAGAAVAAGIAAFLHPARRRRGRQPPRRRRPSAPPRWWQNRPGLAPDDRGE